MGKFAGFLKRVKNFGSNILNGFVNGISKLNNVYKEYKPIVDTGIGIALSALPGGSFAAPVVSFGLDRISKNIDLAKYGIDHPNSFLPSYDKNKFMNDNIRPINIDKRNKNNNLMSERNNNSNIMNDKIKSRLDELRRINTNN